jgi:HK97 family phage portal protein
VKPLAVARSMFGALGFTWNQRGGEVLFSAYGMDRTLGGCIHSLDPLDGTGWQRNLELIGAGALPVVAAIRHLHRSAFAQLRPHHKRQDLDTGKVEEVSTSAAARVLVRPNDYESGADLFARAIDEWLTGEVLLVGMRSGRAEVDSLHCIARGLWAPRVDPDTRAVFYLVSDDESLLFQPITLAEVEGGHVFVVPASDCVHLRWATPRHPLCGESALAAAGLAAGVNVALSRSQLWFVENMRRVSTVLSTDQLLDKAQMKAVRERFDEQSKTWNTGGIPILAGGLKMTSANLAAIDQSVVASLRYSNEDIARCVGVPPPLYGDMTGGAITNTEALINHWLSVSLGGLIERFERGLERLFGMNGRSDYVDLSTEALLRTDLAAQADALSKMVQGGVLMPDEARRHVGEGPAEGGNQLLVQRQMVPLAAAAKLADAELQKLTAPPPPPPVPPQAPTPPADGAPPDQAQAEAKAAALTRAAIERAMNGRS